MTTDDQIRCDLTELIVRECAHCRRIPDPPLPRTHGRPFQAVYDGRCCDCGRQYRVGEQIQRVTDDDGIGYLGPCCREDQP